MDAIGFDRGEIIGYTSMVVAFLLIFFGVRSYRDNVAGGTVRFGRAFAVGALIAVVASLCYVATWEVIYFKFAPGLHRRSIRRTCSRRRADGESEEAIAAKKAEMDRFVGAVPESGDQCGDHVPGAAAGGAGRGAGVGRGVEPAEERQLGTPRSRVAYPGLVVTWDALGAEPAHRADALGLAPVTR